MKGATPRIPNQVEGSRWQGQKKTGKICTKRQNLQENKKAHHPSSRTRQASDATRTRGDAMPLPPLRVVQSRPTLLSYEHRRCRQRLSWRARDHHIRTPLSGVAPCSHSDGLCVLAPASRFLQRAERYEDGRIQKLPFGAWRLLFCRVSAAAAIAFPTGGDRVDETGPNPWLEGGQKKPWHRARFLEPSSLSAPEMGINKQQNWVSKIQFIT